MNGPFQGIDGKKGIPGPYVIPKQYEWVCYSCPMGPPGEPINFFQELFILPHFYNM